jgi:DNA-directed RNA polymerase sigma subunit (sigma70/sigma32)
MFQSIDEPVQEDMFVQLEDNSKDPLLREKLAYKIRDIMLKHLTDREYNVLRLSFGLDCDKLSAKQIAEKLNMKGSSSYVRVSQLKRQAINKLKSVMDYSQVIDYL